MLSNKDPKLSCLNKIIYLSPSRVYIKQNMMQSNLKWYISKKNIKCSFYKATVNVKKYYIFNKLYCNMQYYAYFNKRLQTKPTSTLNLETYVFLWFIHIFYMYWWHLCDIMAKKNFFKPTFKNGGGNSIFF